MADKFIVDQISGIVNTITDTSLINFFQIRNTNIGQTSDIVSITLKMTSDFYWV